MNTIRRIAKNTLVLLIAQIISMGLGFFYMMYTARYLGAEGFGVLSFAMAFTGIFGVFTDLGLSQLTVREIARNKTLADKYIGNIIPIKLFLILLTLFLIVLFINLLGYPPDTILVVYIISISIILNSFVHTFKSIYQAHEKMEYISFFNILNSFLLLVGVVIAINQQFDVIGFAALYLIASLIVLILNIFVIYLRFIDFSFSIDVQFWKFIIKESLPFGLSSIFVVIYFYIDSVMLSLLKGDEVVGWYNASYKLVFILLFIPGVYFSSIYPVMSKLYVSSKESLRFMYSISMKYMLVIGFMIGISTVILADNIIILIFGSEYQPSIIALQILIWAVFFSFLAHAPLYTLNSINRQVIYTKVVFIGVIVNIILNSILIPIYSLIGASAATVFTEFLGFFLLYYLVKKHTGYELENENISKIIVTVSIFIISYMLINLFVDKIISIALSFLLFCGSIYILKVVSDKDLILIKSIFHRT